MFTGRFAELFAVLSRNGRHTVMYHQTVAEQVGLNATDSRTLSYLTEVGSANASQLSEMTGLTTGAVTRIVDRLEKARFVRRRADPKDRRGVMVEPILDGRAMQKMNRLMSPLGEQVGALLDTFSDSELAVILRFIEGATEILKRETERLQGPTP